MTEQHHNRRVPRDLPDQQAGHHKDHWDAPTKDDAREVPDTDEAGAGPRGAPESAGVRPDQPVPDEPSG
ncbi:hypothetical protein [Streptomyces bauhiniae]|uniref:Uncharacterized protein n=1 Tax=Streptomyces bauhiniae TaxID=2340725 RepID=A0A7K3QLX7_9ACTN|nr:hypothetical protein [Streptomyces bauhiniae]NEB90901.1 hypothetical protein [Streptomyces bauhiniae]